MWPSKINGFEFLLITEVNLPLYPELRPTIPGAGEDGDDICLVSEIAQAQLPSPAEAVP